MKLKSNGRLAVIKSINNNNPNHQHDEVNTTGVHYFINEAVIEFDDQTTLSGVSLDDMSPVQPREKDRVIIVEDRTYTGTEGELVLIDQDEAIVKDDANEDFRIVQLVRVAKIATSLV